MLNKVGDNDLTMEVGGTHPRRAWLSPLMALLAQPDSVDPRLLKLDSEIYTRLFHSSRTLAALPASHPHRLRHGGASMDGLNKLGDLEMQRRGQWRSPKSLARYRKPGRYLRQLDLLSSAQLTRVVRIEAELPGLFKLALLHVPKRREAAEARKSLALRK